MGTQIQTLQGEIGPGVCTCGSGRRVDIQGGVLRWIKGLACLCLGFTNIFAHLVFIKFYKGPCRNRLIHEKQIAGIRVQ